MLFLPDSAGRDFLTTSVVASISPFSIDVIGVAMTLGVGLDFNVLTAVGIAIGWASGLGSRAPGNGPLTSS